MSSFVAGAIWLLFPIFLIGGWVWRFYENRLPERDEAEELERFKQILAEYQKRVEHSPT